MKLVDGVDGLCGRVTNEPSNGKFSSSSSTSVGCHGSVLRNMVRYIEEAETEAGSLISLRQVQCRAVAAGISLVWW